MKQKLLPKFGSFRENPYLCWKLNIEVMAQLTNAETLAAMKEAESGHDAGVVRVDSLESFMASMEE